jgi:hypothetical protein
MSGDQFAVLVNHPNSQIDGIQTRSEFDRLSTDIDLSFVGLIFPEEDFHQGGFPGTILTQDGVNLTRLDFEINTVVGNNSRESFCDPSCL